MHDVVKWQTMSGCCILLAVLLLASPGAPEPTDQENSPGPSLGQVISDQVRDAKRDLAQSFLKTQLRKRDTVSVTRAFTWKLGTIQGSAASTFRSFNQSFILAGRELHRLKQGEGLNLSTETVAHFNEFLGDVAFIESVEWDGLLLVLAAYKQGLLQLFTVAQDNAVILRQSINAYGVPTDAEFFVQDEKLFLVVVANNETSPAVPVVVYHWLDTHLDEENRLFLTAPIAVSAFSYKESVMIVVALQAVGMQKAGLAVLRRSRTKFVMVQYMPTDGPTAIQHYVFKGENYLLVNNRNGASIIAWWSGTELAVWDKLHVGDTFHSVGVGYVRDETLLLLSEKNFVKVYRPTEGPLQLLDVLNLPGSVQSASLYVAGQSVFLLVLTQTPAGDLLPLVLELRLVFQPATLAYENEHPLVSCLTQLKQALAERRSTLELINSERARLLRRDVAGVFTGRLFVEKLNVTKDVSVGSVLWKSSPLVSTKELKDLISRAYDEAESLKAGFADVVSRTKPETLSAKLIAQELEIRNASMDAVIISELNGQPFNPSNLLMYSKVQKFSGVITVDKMVVDTLFVQTLNGKKVDDLLRRRGDQAVYGLRQVPHLSTSYIRMTDINTINEISLHQLVTVKTSKSTPITGHKTFPGLNLQSLAVDLLNNVNFTNWIESLRPPSPIEMDVTVKTTVELPKSGLTEVKGDLKLVNLTIDGDINGLKFEDLIASLFLKGINQRITDDVTYSNSVIVQDLTATFANDIHTNSLLTKNTPQVVNGNITIDSLIVSDLKADSINGLKISRDAAYINSPFSVSSRVAFRKVQVDELGLPPHATIQGKQLGRRLVHKPLTKYEGKVKVKGNVMLTDFNLERSKILLNGQTLTLRDLPLLYWTKSTEQVINVPIVAPSGLAVRSLNIGAINDISPGKFVNLRSTEVLRGQWSFDSAVVFGNLSHYPQATQTPVSPLELASSVVRTTGKYTLHGNKIFIGGLTTNELNAQYLDEKEVATILKRDLSRGGGSYRELRIKGDLLVRSDVLVNNTVNQVNLCERMSRVVLKDTKATIPSISISAVNATRINVVSLNGSPTTVWLVPTPGATATRRVKKVTLRGDLRVPSLLHVQSVNNKDVTPEYLKRVVDRNVGGLIRGKKTFKGSMIVHGAFDAPHYSGIDLRDVELYTLSKTKRQGIPYPITMAEMTTVSLFAEHVNDIPVRSLLSSDQFGRQTIKGNVIFTNDVDVKGVLDVANLENGCDLHMVAEKLQVLDGRQWASVTVSGDLSWDRSLSDRKKNLGYFMKSAVTTRGNQVIVGEVVFGQTVHTNNVYSRMDINDFDIDGIMKDSLRKSARDQFITGEKLFQQKLSTSSMRVDGNVVAMTVAGVHIQNLNRSLVRVMGDYEVRGHKNFLRGFTADMLKIDGLFNDFPTSVIATYDMPNLPPMVFASSLEILEDLTATNVNGFSLYDLLKQRVTLDGSQLIHGHITFEQDLNVQGDLITPSINQIDLVDIVSIDSAEEQVVTGTKHFKESIHVVGPMNLGFVHGSAFVMAHRAALFRDEDAMISGDLVFGNTVTMERGLLLDNTINGMRMEELSVRLRSPISRNVGAVRTIARTINDTRTLLRARGDLSELLYLEPVSAVPLAVSQTRRAVSTDLGSGEVRVDVYGWEWSRSPGLAGACGLPSHCACPVQYTLQVSGATLRRSSLVRSNVTSRSFRLRSQSGLLVRVLSSTVSSSSRCQLSGEQHRNEFTTIAWMTPTDAPHVYDNFADVTIDPSPIMGYLSDAKLIEVNGRVYVALGLAYSTELDSTEMNSVLLRLDTVAHKAYVINEIPTKGVLALDVFYTNAGAHLIVANSFASRSLSTQAHVDIYRFDALSEKLRLYRRIVTEGVVAVASVVHRGDSLVIIAQEQPFAPVLVLKHDASKNDYHFVQQLTPNAVPTGLNVFYIGKHAESDAFLGISTADNLFHLFKYCHVEGFKPVMKMELRGVQGFTSFNVGNTQYLFFASSERSSVFEIVKQS